MIQKTLTLLNTSVLTGYGTFVYQPMLLDEAQKLVREFQQGCSLSSLAVLPCYKRLMAASSRSKRRLD
jgi:hypothetical protein